MRERVHVQAGQCVNHIGAQCVNHIFEQEVKVADVFNQDGMIDIVGVCKGHGYNGVITRWGCSRLVRKSHLGLRKVACIGTWRPARMQVQGPRAGQRGYHHRTVNKKIYGIDKALKDDPNGAMTENDLTENDDEFRGSCIKLYLSDNLYHLRAPV